MVFGCRLSDLGFGSGFGVGFDIDERVWHSEHLGKQDAETPYICRCPLVKCVLNSQLLNEQTSLSLTATFSGLE